MDARLAQGGSLLLARFLVWLQVSYMRSQSIVTLLKTLGVFISSPDGTRYVSEMIEGGLLITLLDILLKQKFNDMEKMEAMELLNMIAFRGRRYKEAICESHGVKVLCEFIAVTGLDSKHEEETATGDTDHDSNVIKLDSNDTKNLKLNGKVVEIGLQENVVVGDEDDEVSVPFKVVVPQGKQQLLEELRLYNEKHDSKELASKTDTEQGEIEVVEVEDEEKEEEESEQTQLDTKLTSNEPDTNEMEFVTVLENGQDVCNILLKKSQELLVNVASGNAAYQTQIMRALFQLMTSINHWAQIVACKVIRKILSQTMELCGEIIEPLMGLLGHSNIRLLYEALELIDIVVMSEWKTKFITRLLTLVVGPQPLETLDKHPLYITEPDLSDFQESQLVSQVDHQIQADAILAIGRALNIWTVDEFIGSEVVLVATLANSMHQESRRRAAQVLCKLVQLVPSLKHDLTKIFPSGLMDRIMVDPVDTANNLSVADAKYLQMWAHTKYSIETEK